MTTASTIRTVSIQRVSVATQRSFDDVLAALRTHIGQPSDLPELVKRWNTAESGTELERSVAEIQGDSGLIEFLALDLGAVLAVRHPAHSYKMVRIIAGNPVTMSDMAATVPDVGSYAPVTILVVELPDGVQIHYDKIASAIGDFDEPEAQAVARRLDNNVLQAIQQAAGLSSSSPDHYSHVR